MSKLKVGVFGVRRGYDYIRALMVLGCDVVAICENREELRNEIAGILGEGTKAYDKFEDFIEHDMDAVVIANNFHEHVPYVIECFKRNIHVFSECMAASTMAECVALARAYEKSNSIYMLAENYPMMIFNREMKRICDGGSLGKIVYAEGEYAHPVSPVDFSFYKTHIYNEKHWRNYLPRAYYLTHSLGPIMYATGATPVKVTALASFAPFGESLPSARYCGDNLGVIMTQNNDGSIFKFTGCAAFGAHGNSYRVCGTEGQFENQRGTENNVMLRYNPWSKPEGMEENNCYVPDWNDPDEDLLKKHNFGHGGADYFITRLFVDCIKENHQPPMPFDVYSAIVMSEISILSHRSVLEGGKFFDIPNFRDEEVRKQYENDKATPFWTENDTVPPSIPCCSVQDYKPTDEQLKRYFDELKK